ncbi:MULTISPECIES: DNA-binding protein [Paraburkholderia]|uniref:DNA-binding protein n=1 Tax=Paraburkholderia madseniana TaxID=2599607 RepID=A0AAP5BIU6_9BURK|nr:MULTISPECIES: DNA-binding protein [Paraburkholderia]MCX4150323.1 DNA-binding protein [Paraburkholderia madseniana]MDN7153256.1 DNA-binding protein [Paraburkholderia sp. WS6]MDQ6412138.1 DNA-binding protein [Paraburkholderia madseniana]
MPDALPAVQPDEARLAAEIDSLKVEFPRTRELYREVCALLFFRFGQTPTANRLYQLVRRGSMGTPAAVLGEFWAELREKSRLRIEHPDLPADLGAAAGELVAILWTRATASAEAALDALRDEVEAQRVEAQQAVVAARDELGRTETALEQRTAALLAAQVEIRDLDRAHAEGHAQRQALGAELARVQAALAARERELVEARERFSGELEKLRASADLAEDRLRAAEKRALLEIERERVASARLQKELVATTRKGEQGETRHRSELQAVQAQLANARHQAGVLEGSLVAVRDASAGYAQELGMLRQQMTGAVAPRSSGRKGVSVTVPARKQPRATRKAASAKKPG